MKDSTKFAVKKPLEWYNKELKTDFKKFFISLTKAVIMFSSATKAGNLAGIASGMKEVPDIFNSFSLKEDISGLAYTMMLKAMANASYDIVVENVGILEELFKSEDDLINNDSYIDFLDSLNSILEKEELTIDNETLRIARSLSFLPKFCEQFSNWLIFLGLEESTSKVIANRLPAYFVLALNDEWKNDSSYALINKKIETPVTEAAKNEIIWQRYNSFLQKQIDSPVFDEPFSLRQIYVPLRAYYLHEKEWKDSDGNLMKGIRRKPIDLEAELNNWLSTDNVRDSIKFLSGGPGSGKSSFAKMWAAKLAEKGAVRTLFIPLHLFDMQGDIFNSVGSFAKSYPELKISYNPLENRAEKILIIFDGLDELSQQGKYALEVASQFVDAISYLNNFINSDKNINNLFLITGRDVSIQNNTSKFRLDKQILHLLPYYTYDADKWRFGLSKDEEELIDQDQRDIWWEKYASLIGREYDSLPQELRLERLDEITAQPLLNYLVALSLKRGKISLTTETNLNDIYADLIEGVHERAYEKYRKFAPIELLELKDFKRILEEIALSAWHGGDVRTTSVKKIEHHMENNNLKPLLEKFKTEAKKE